MLKKFEVNIHKNTLFSKTDRLLVAFSGGMDSMVLCDLLKKTGYTFDVAHCNFQLRGPEAQADTEFCRMYAKSVEAHFHVMYFDTKAYAEQEKLSIQMAARELRYTWFQSLLNEQGYTYILTAHHANDTVETLFVNLIRGTGIKGLQGIPEKQNHILRPLLFATKEEIENYALSQQITFREDSSNQEVKYKRNFIRHRIVPELKKLNPTLEQTILTSIQFFKQSSEIVMAFADMKFKEICKQEQGQLFIHIQLLLQEPQKETLLFEWLYLKDFKTRQIQQLTEVLLTNNYTGKQFSSATHQLVIDRQYILVKERDLHDLHPEFVINTLSDIDHLPIPLHFEQSTTAEFSTNKQEITISWKENLFPLTLRRWKQGDKFKPFGMTGFKKLSDYFKDQKFSLFQKEAAWILESREHIIWVVGHRMDDRCKVTDDSEKLLRIFTNADNMV